MCDIFGFNWKDGERLRLVTELINHRGPDLEGYYTDESVNRGHKRLSIIDLSLSGKQPIFNEDEKVCIVFQYNRWMLPGGKT